jgi:hypothetical protein
MVARVSKAMSTIPLPILAAGLALPAVSALAHHSAAMFEAERAIEHRHFKRHGTGDHEWLR